MSDVTPNPNGRPEANDGTFNFDSLHVEETAPLTHEPPQPEKRSWKDYFTGNAKSKTSANSASEPKKRKLPKPAPAHPKGGLIEPLENMYVSIGMVVLSFDPHCGNTIIENANACAKSLDDLAKRNPAVRRVLMRLISTSALGAVITAHAPIMMAIAMHHVPALQKNQEQFVGQMFEQFTKEAAEGKDNE